MSGDLYGALGLGKGASEQDIRRAYRERAKQAHPDAGGSAESFGALKVARDVLLDPERRKRYDDTGNFEAGDADNRMAHILDTVILAVDQAITLCVQGGLDPAQCDLKAGAISKLREMDRALSAQVTEFDETQRIMRKVAKRWRKKVKKGEPQRGPNHLEMMFEQRSRAVDGARELIAKNRKLIAEALIFLEDYSFEADTVQQTFMHHRIVIPAGGGGFGWK